MNQKNGSFLDRNTLLAILLVGAVWFGWQSYLNKKYGAEQKNQVKDQVAQSEGAGQGNSETTKTEKASPASPAPSEETFTLFENSGWKLKISSQGMGFSEIKLKNYTDRGGKEISIGSPRAPYPFQTYARGITTPLNFSIKVASDSEIVGVARHGNTVITKTYRVNPSDFTIHTFFKIEKIESGFTGLSTYFSEEDLKPNTPAPEGKDVASMADQWQEYFVAHGSTTDRAFGSSKSPYEKDFTAVSVASLSSHYFSMAAVDKSQIAPVFKTRYTNNTFLGELSYEVVPGVENQNLEFKGFLGPKSVDFLRKADPRLVEVVDYGWFSWIAEPLLRIMKWFYSMFHNYGVAIILLTVLVRIVVLPFNVMSYKSMKVMQKLKPEMDAIREKFKDDPQTQQLKTMQLMKDNKANPLGGCLPMFLQLPVFIALYRVLGQSIELYKAPFIFWLHDLSLKDPFYVLPVLMGITMFIQQKITPTTMDPAQAKVMQWMPVIFTVFMVNLPSGLNLYIFVSTLFGIIQQMLFMRERKPETSSVRVQA